MHISEVKVNKILGQKAIEILALAGKEENISQLITKTIEYGSDANIEELGAIEIVKLVDKINKLNGFDQDFQKALETSGKSTKG